ncbi:MAG: AAA family ATPase, partial [Oscillibacter sp.]|nr:AAA family ATPase [Oscillibacter sp.]
SGDQSGPRFHSPDNFFPYMLQLIQSGSGNTAFILDYSDFLFGNANALSEKEREFLVVLKKALDRSKSYRLNQSDFEENGSIVVLVTQNAAMIPPAYYLNNPLVSTINVPPPGRNERAAFLDANLNLLRVRENLSGDRRLKDDFIDALDGFTLKEIAQIMKLSRQGDRMAFPALLNLYKYGEKNSPWEELSREKLRTIKERLSERVKGQEQAIAKVEEVIIRAYTGFSGLQHSARSKKPKGTLFFVGPTGVGKTELAKALAEFVFGDENACIRFDMSEYNHEHSDQRLVGAPPGYVGYEAGGQLTNAIREKPFCVLLFDEIEKADGKILDKFLQILEDGRLTDGKGETVYFSESIIIFTSNIGAGSVSPDIPPDETRKHFVKEVREYFLTELKRPELLNRIGDNIVAFHFIENEEIFSQIAKSKFRGVINFVKERYRANVVFDDENEVFLAIARQSEKRNGGRGMLNVMERELVNRLAKCIFEEESAIAGRDIVISTHTLGKSGKVVFDVDVR